MSNSEEKSESSEVDEVEHHNSPVKKGRLVLSEAVSKGGKVKEIKIVKQKKEGLVRRVDKRREIEEAGGDVKIGYVHLKTGKTGLYETPAKKYYTLKKNKDGIVSKNYVTKRVKEGKLDVYNN